MNQLKYNYVFLNSTESYDLNENRNMYCAICTRDLESFDGATVVTYPYDYSNKFVQALFFLHNSNRINRRINLPLKRLWYPGYFKNEFKDDKPLCFILLNRFWFPPEYFKWLKKKYPDAKFVLLLRDLMKISDNPFSKRFVGNPLFDLQMTIDRDEAKQYGMVYFDEYESKIDVPIAKDYPISDVFFAGKVKDRMEKLMTAYDIFTKAGLKCEFYLTGTPEDQKKPLEGVTYAEKSMPYIDMLYKTVNTRCVLEFNQEGALGFTSRFLEAVMYNKLLITDNPAVKDTKFYDPSRILCVEKASDIDPTFVLKNSNSIDYHYNGEFSPLRLLEQIDKELIIHG